jgi:hypothetical protein
MGTVDEKSILRVPEPPEINYPGHPGMPEEVQNAWRDTYRRTLKQSLGVQGGEPNSAHHQAALTAANQAHVNAPHPETYEEAMALPRWQWLVPPHEEPEMDGNGNPTGRKVLRGITIHGQALRRPPVGRKAGRKGIPIPEGAKATKGSAAKSKAGPQVVAPGAKMGVTTQEPRKE